MHKTFFIGISMRAPEELIPLARFPIGDDKEFAEELYDSLKGSTTGLNESPLLMEWTEEQLGLPQNLCLKACSLKDVAHNCEVITKALFRKHTLR
jgi:hypothetical protein